MNAQELKERNLKAMEKRLGFIPAGVEQDRTTAKFRYIVDVMGAKGERKIIANNLTYDAAQACAATAGKESPETSAVRVMRDFEAEIKMKAKEKAKAAEPESEPETVPADPAPAATQPAADVKPKGKK